MPTAREGDPRRDTGPLARLGRAAAGLERRAGRLEPGWAAFALVFLAYVLYLPTSGYAEFHYDSALYWRLGDSFVSDGRLTLLDYPDPLRGYSFPLGLAVLRGVATALEWEAITVVRVANAALFALIGTQLLPRLASRVFPGARVTLWRVLVLNGLLFLFWRDYANFPLSDFPVLALFGFALLLALRRRPYAAVAAGVLAGLAMNSRPAYALAAFLLVALVAVRAHGPGSGARWRRSAAAAALALVGIAVALAPQIAINRHGFGSVSPFPAESDSLAFLQLSVGLQAQKYETTIDREASQPGVYFLDPATTLALSEREDFEVESYGEYLSIFAGSPLRLGLGYVRRFFNGVDVQYPSPYVRDIDADRDPFRSFVLYSLLFAAGWLLVSGRRGGSLGAVEWKPGALFLLPALTAVPGAVEPRFFLPMSLAALAILCFHPDATGTFRALGGARRVLLILACGAFLTGCFLLASQTYSEIGQPPLAP